MGTKTYARADLPIRKPLKIQIGDDFIGPAFVHKNPDGSPVDLTGYAITGTIVMTDGSTQALAFTRDDAAGTYVPTLPRATTASFEEQTARYDIDLTDTLDKKTTYWGGPVAIVETI